MRFKTDPAPVDAVRRPVAVPPGVDPGHEPRARPEGPRAAVPAPPPSYPMPTVLLIAVCALVIGVHTMFVPLTTGGWWAGFGFTAFGLLIGGIWVRLWWLWHEAWGRWKP